MNRIVRVLCAIAGAVCISLPVQALDTTASNYTERTVAPFNITAVSFQGSQLQYLQVFNDSSEVARLDGWRLQVTSNDGTQTIIGISLVGLVAPHNYVTIADINVLPSASFTYHGSIAAVNGPSLQTFTLLAPPNSLFLDSVSSVTVSNSTARNNTTIPPTFYFSRNISQATGNYTSTFSASSLPPSSLFSDPLYLAPTMNPLKIVEIYNDAGACSPADTSQLCFDYVKLYNNSASPADLSQFRLRTGSLGQPATNSNAALLSTELGAYQYISFPLNLSSSGNWVWFEDAYGVTCYDATIEQYPSNSGHAGQAWSFNTSRSAWQWTSYPSPGTGENVFSETGAINQCVGLKLSEIAANTDQQFIEVYNAISGELDISGCQLQTNRSATTSYRFANGTILQPNQHVAIAITQSNLTLTKTTSGTVYVLSSDGVDEVDQRQYENLAEGTSYSLIGDQWLQTYTLTPGTVNSYAEYPACQADYQRNYETGRCNKI